MATLLKIDASARTARSLSREFGSLFLKTWQDMRPDDSVIVRDVARNPPPLLSEAWITGAAKPELLRTEEERRALAVSDTLIEEVEAADLILLATPMYNYGMPAALKAWVDMVVRINRTFSFDLSRGDYPLAPMLAGKTMVVVTSSGEFGFAPGGVRESMNHLMPHLETIKHYLGVERLHRLGAEYQEFGDERHERSVEAARLRSVELARDLAARWPA